jgi:F0F1-type ATP synthase epsilon subunit
MIEEKTDAAKQIEDVKKEQEAAKNSKPSMHIKVYSPFKVYFDDEADSISGVNATGPFDILPKHHNFMTLLAPCELIIRTFRGEERIRISGGLMHVKADQVIVFLDI